MEAFFLTTLLPEAALLLVSLCGCPDGVERVLRLPDGVEGVCGKRLGALRDIIAAPGAG